MSEMWAVSSGSYSDYSVNALFTSKELAEQVAKQANEAGSTYRDEHWVESFHVWDHNPGVRVWWTVNCIIDADGTPSEVARGGVPVEATTQPEIRSWAEPIFDPDMDLRPVSWSWLHRLEGNPSHGGVLSVSGTDRERVAHVFKDRRAIYMTDPAARLVPLAGDRRNHA